MQIGKTCEESLSLHKVNWGRQLKSFVLNTLKVKKGKKKSAGLSPFLWGYIVAGILNRKCPIDTQNGSKYLGNLFMDCWPRKSKNGTLFNSWSNWFLVIIVKRIREYLYLEWAKNFQTQNFNTAHLTFCLVGQADLIIANFGWLRPIGANRNEVKVSASTVMEVENPRSSNHPNMGIYGLALTSWFQDT